jgi:hypothetical protein
MFHVKHFRLTFASDLAYLFFSEGRVRKALHKSGCHYEQSLRSEESRDSSLRSE